MEEARRVVITGIGVVAPNGIGRTAYWDALAAGVSGVDWIKEFDPTPYSCKVAASVRDFIPENFMSRRRVKQCGRFAQFAVAAAKMAVDDAGLQLAAERPERVLACIGNAMNGSGDVYEVARQGWQTQGVAGIPFMSGMEFAAHAAATHVSMELGLRGQAMTIASACSTGLDVFQWAADKLREGAADVVIAGSTEAPLSEFCFATLAAFRCLSDFDDPPLRASRPFDLRRSGLVLGEGSAVMIVEELSHALDRGATIYAEILGFGTGNESGVTTRRNASQIAFSMAIGSALENARRKPSEIDYVNAHGNGMPDFDRIDTAALHLALGHAAYNTPISSTKSMIGHAMGAAGSLQVAATCLALVKSTIPPTINYETPDPDCDLDYVPNIARVSRVRTALVNAHAIGGTFSSLVLGAADRL